MHDLSNFDSQSGRGRAVLSFPGEVEWAGWMQVGSGAVSSSHVPPGLPQLPEPAGAGMEEEEEEGDKM